MPMLEWEQANPRLTKRSWLTEHMDRILVGGLRRYTGSSKSPPDLLDPTNAVLKNLVIHAYTELKQIYLDGFEDDRGRQSKRYSTLRDTVSRKFSLSDSPTNLKNHALLKAALTQRHQNGGPILRKTSSPCSLSRGRSQATGAWLSKHREDSKEEGKRCD